jgi:hypothetical protein
LRRLFSGRKARVLAPSIKSWPNIGAKIKADRGEHIYRIRLKTVTGEKNKFLQEKSFVT